MHTEYHEEGHTHKDHIFLWILKFSRYPRGFVSGSSYNEFEAFMIIWLWPHLFIFVQITPKIYKKTQKRNFTLTMHVILLGVIGDPMVICWNSENPMNTFYQF